MWLLAFKAMFADRPKLLTSVLGVAFSVVLINLQGGLLLGLLEKASQLVDYGQADIWVGHRHMNNVDIGTLIPERWIQRIRGVAGVERAEPYIVAFGQATMKDGRFENVVVVGCDPATLLGNAWAMDRGEARAVRDPDGVLVDVCDAEKLGDCKLGDIREISGHRAKIVGLTKGIVGFTTNPYLFTTLDRPRHKFTTAGIPEDQCSFFLVRAKPGVSIPDLCERIRERVPDLAVYDKRTYSLMSMEYWATRTGIGLSFGLAALLGLLVGLAIVAQTLYASVTERIKEFGTLKAMGAADRAVSRFLVAQALGSAGMGSIVGLAAAVGLGQLLTTPRAPVELTWWIAAGSVVVITMICLLAAWLPYWRIRRIDPASVLRS